MNTPRLQEITMPIIEIDRVKIDPANVARLLQIRGAAMAEFREQLPQLRQADLVRLDDNLWLDIRTWMEAVDSATVAEAAQFSPTHAEMRALMRDRLGHDRGDRVHTTGTAWAAGR
jgi:hypothetical protein